MNTIFTNVHSCTENWNGSIQFTYQKLFFWRPSILRSPTCSLPFGYFNQNTGALFVYFSQNTARIARYFNHNTLRSFRYFSQTLCTLLVTSIKTMNIFLFTSIKTLHTFCVTSITTLCTLLVIQTTSLVRPNRLWFEHPNNVLLEYHSQTSRYWNVLQPTVTSSVVGPNIFVSTIVSNVPQPTPFP